MSGNVYRECLNIQSVFKDYLMQSDGICFLNGRHSIVYRHIPFTKYRIREDSVNFVSYIKRIVNLNITVAMRTFFLVSFEVNRYGHLPCVLN